VALLTKPGITIEQVADMGSNRAERSHAQVAGKLATLRNARDEAGRIGSRIGTALSVTPLINSGKGW
jgi:hypothetical protein